MKIDTNKIRTRFAPSPTGALHVGNVRTALYNYLFAKKNGGAFVLRIEDTDKERSSAEYEREIIDNLKWLGLNWTEGPFRQSERTEIYSAYLRKLLDLGFAYYCFCSEEELESQRQYQMSRGEAPRYSGKCSILDSQASKKFIEGGKPAVIRLRMPAKKVAFLDLIRGKVEFDTSLFGDIVIAKDLETPLYNLAVVIDDYEMDITHVIRGEDHISNTPKQILLREVLGLKHEICYAHLPLILGPDRSKLSSRHGAISVGDYRKAGYLPEAMVNFLAFLGWNPGEDRDIYSMSSLIKEFDLESVQKSGAVFNLKKLDFLNGFYIRNKSLDDITEMCIPYLIEAGLIKKDNYEFDSIKKMVSLYQERMKKLSEIVEFVDFFFNEELGYERGLLKWKEADDSAVISVLDQIEEVLSDIEDWTITNLEDSLLPLAEKMGDRGILLWPLRVALTGKQFSAGPFEIAELLGKEKTLNRIKKARLLFK